MSKALRPLHLRVALIAIAAITMLALAASTAAAVNVHLRIEGQSKTYFSGDVDTTAGSVAAAADQPNCRSNGTASVFANPNTITAAAAALGGDKVGTSGTFYSWGTLVCNVDGEASTDSNGGWLVRINQQDSTSPNGYVLATDPLSNNDSVVLFFSPSYGYYTASLELNLPATAKPGQTITGYVDSYNTADDTKSAGSGVSVTGGASSTTSASDGSFQITFPAAGRYLVSANKSGALRGSRWITIAEDANTTPVAPVTQKQINKQRRIAARAACRQNIKSRSSDEYKSCIRAANQLGRTLTAKQKRIAAREKCVKLYPNSGSGSRVKCIRDANRIGRQ
ncbi:MAG: carboxypeptidase-like regulatory domain-containing protein [Solirubrobacterales bacterium]